MRIYLTGCKEIDAALQRLAAEEGAKSINGAMRTSTRRVAKAVAREISSVAHGRLKGGLKVRKIKNEKGVRGARRKVGHSVSYTPNVEKIDQGRNAGKFFAVFPEYGTTGQRPQKFMRGSLYRNKGFAIKQFRADAYTVINQAKARGM